MQVFAPVTSFKVFLAKVTPMEGGFPSYNENKLAQTLGVIGERKKKLLIFFPVRVFTDFPGVNILTILSFPPPFSAGSHLSMVPLLSFLTDSLPFIPPISLSLSHALSHAFSRHERNFRPGQMIVLKRSKIV